LGESEYLSGPERQKHINVRGMPESVPVSVDDQAGSEVSTGKRWDPSATNLARKGGGEIKRRGSGVQVEGGNRARAGGKENFGGGRQSLAEGSIQRLSQKGARAGEGGCLG